MKYNMKQRIQINDCMLVDIAFRMYILKMMRELYQVQLKRRKVRFKLFKLQIIIFSVFFCGF